MGNPAQMGFSHAEFVFSLPTRIVRRAYTEFKVERLKTINKRSKVPVIQADGPVVSLTSYGKRIDTVYLTIESIACGSLLPSELILWLDEGPRYQSLPSTLGRLKDRGMTVRLCKNYGPHKKYYPYVDAHEKFVGPLVTADDDILYPNDWLKSLMDAFEQDPEVVNGFRARVMSFEGDRLAPYMQWSLCSSTKASWRHLLNGASGVIYPPRLLEAVKRAGPEFVQCCPKADDIWLHANALRAGFKVRQIRPQAIHFPMIPGSQETALYFDNADTGNDVQIAKTYTSRELQRIAAE
jgi:hypothetical protein